MNLVVIMNLVLRWINQGDGMISTVLAVGDLSVKHRKVSFIGYNSTFNGLMAFIR